MKFEDFFIPFILVLILLITTYSILLEDRVSELETKLNPDAKIIKVVDCSNNTEEECEMIKKLIIKKEEEQ